MKITSLRKNNPTLLQVMFFHRVVTDASDESGKESENENRFGKIARHFGS